MRFDQRTILVSGGASGLGAATVAAIVDGGGRAVVLDRQPCTVETSDTGPVRSVVGDVTDEHDVLRAITLAKDTFGALDGAVCTAGVVLAERTLGRDGPHDLERFAHLVQVNLIGTFNVVRLAAAAMAANAPAPSGERGVIVTTASIAAFDGQIGQAAYAASKGGVVAMTLPLARELARLGIRVMTIAPGTFDTPLLSGLPDAARASLAQQVPFPPRLGRPAEFAALVRHIFENEMLNGDVIRLDGAIRMAPK